MTLTAIVTGAWMLGPAGCRVRSLEQSDASSSPSAVASSSASSPTPLASPSADTGPIAHTALSLARDLPDGAALDSNVPESGTVEKPATNDTDAAASAESGESTGTMKSTAVAHPANEKGDNTPQHNAPPAPEPDNEGIPKTPSFMADFDDAPEPPPRTVVIAIGGSGVSATLSGQVQHAVTSSLRTIVEGKSALQAVVDGTSVLENNASFNAGTGSALRHDGVSIRMDALVMDSRGRFGAVGSIGLVRNPVRVAYDVLENQLGLVASTDALVFARHKGHLPYDPTTSAASRRWQEAMSRSTSSSTSNRASAEVGVEADGEDVHRHTDAAPVQVFNAGMVIRTSNDEFAAACSDGGQTGQAVGTIGACSIVGASVFVGIHGAVVVSGPDDWLIKKALAQWIYERIERGDSPKQAVSLGLAQVPEEHDVAAAAIDTKAHFMAGRGAVAWGSYPTITPDKKQRTGAR